jgi:hypothetical protein
MPIFDQFHDPGYGRLRHLLADHPGAAALLKEASIEDTEPELPPGAYAWPERQLFPVHSAEHAALSHLYAKTSEVSVPDHVRAKIAQALDAYDVPADAFAQAQPKLAADEDCLFSGGRYPVRNAKEVKTAELRLLPQVSKLTGDERIRAFSKLAEAAQVHGVNLAPESLRLACKTASNPERLAVHLEARAHSTSDPALGAKFASLAAAVRNSPKDLAKEDTRLKVAAFIHELDRKAGFEARYDRDMEDPARVVSNTQKTASAACDIGGRQFSHADLARIPMDLYKHALGDDIESSIGHGGTVNPKLAAEVLSTLPADMKKSFSKLVTSYKF